MELMPKQAKAGKSGPNGYRDFGGRLARQVRNARQ
jgi:hypothetical protein